MICDKQKGNTALHIASLTGKLEVVKILLVNGSSVNARSTVSIVTAQHIACKGIAYATEFLSVLVSVRPSVCHTHEPCQNENRCT